MSTCEQKPCSSSSGSLLQKAPTLGLHNGQRSKIRISFVSVRSVDKHPGKLQGGVSLADNDILPGRNQHVDRKHTWGAAGRAAALQTTDCCLLLTEGKHVGAFTGAEEASILEQYAVNGA